MKNHSSLISLWKRALTEVDPVNLLAAHPQIRLKIKASGAATTGFLFWGKAALRCAEAVGRVSDGTPVLGIAPVEERAEAALARPFGLWTFAEHPLPGTGSFLAGQRLLGFFDELRVREIRHLEIFLSGGASSLAWVRPADWNEEDLVRQLREWYAQPISIQELNRRRAKLCALKGGGAARCLHRLAPRVRARAWVISDVTPFGVETVGSGPFWDDQVSHRVLADNSTLVDALARHARAQGWRIADSSSGCLAPWEKWAGDLASLTRQALLRGDAALLLRGGEARVSLPAGADVRPGGRQTQVAAALAALLSEEIAIGRVELLCMSSDGVDGRSGAAGASIARRPGEDPRQLAAKLRKLGGEARAFTSARGLGRLGYLVPQAPTGTNVQDVTLVRVRPS